MTDALVLIIGMPVAIAAGVFFGRMYMRHEYKLHLPYNERT